MPAFAQKVPLGGNAPGEPAKYNPIAWLGTDPNQVIGSLIKILLGFIGTLSLLFVVLGGYRLILARGNADEIKKGKETIVYAIIGVILSLMSYVIVSLVVATLTSAK